MPLQRTSSLSGTSAVTSRPKRASWRSLTGTCKRRSSIRSRLGTKELGKELGLSEVTVLTALTLFDTIAEIGEQAGERLAEYEEVAVGLAELLARVGGESGFASISPVK